MGPVLSVTKHVEGCVTQQHPLRALTVKKAGVSMETLASYVMRRVELVLQLATQITALLADIQKRCRIVNVCVKMGESGTMSPLNVKRRSQTAEIVLSDNLHSLRTSHVVNVVNSVRAV
jgi:hypothetical protein